METFLHSIWDASTTFLRAHWDKVILTVVAVYGAVLSTYTFIHGKRKDRAAQESSVRTLQSQMAASERGHKIAAKSALLTSYNQRIAMIEERNNIWMQKGEMTRIETLSLHKRVDALEAELDSLTES